MSKFTPDSAPPLNDDTATEALPRTAIGKRSDALLSREQTDQTFREWVERMAAAQRRMVEDEAYRREVARHLS